MIPHEIAVKIDAALQNVVDPQARLDAIMDTVSVKDIVEAAQKAGDYCCQDGCGGGACETCACCGAGWCVSGADGVPIPGTAENPADDPDHAAELYGFWLEAAAEKNPVAKALADSPPVVPLTLAIRIGRMLREAPDRDAEIKAIARFLDELGAPRDARDKLTVDRAPDTLVSRLFPEIQPLAYSRELAATLTGLYDMVTRRALPADRLDISSIRFELRQSPLHDNAYVFRASARLNPPDGH